MREIARWDREFQVWQYSVSHSVLLLRSIESNEGASRIDILFPAVEFMQLKPTYGFMHIQEMSREDWGSVMGGLADSLAHGALFSINQGEGYVHAASCAWHEDEGDHHTPSRFGPLRGTP